MNDRLERLEFFTLYELYLKKNEEFRQAVRARRDKAELEGLRDKIQMIYHRLSEKRPHRAQAPFPGQIAPSL